MGQYDKLAKQYYDERLNDDEFNYNKLIEIPNMLKLVGDVQDKIVLDLGCGFGDHAKLYSGLGAKQIIGFDVSNELLLIAKNQNINNCSFFQADLNSNLDLDDRIFDLVTSSLTISYIKNIEQLFSEVNRVLKSNGLFIFSILNPVTNASVKSKFSDGKESILGVRKYDDGHRDIFGNYFDDSKKEFDLGKGKVASFYNRTYQMLIRLILDAGFEIIDYVDAKPIKEASLIDKGKYELTTKIPTICFFKLRKK